MATPLILRLIYKRVEPAGSQKVQAGLFGDSYNVKLYSVALKGLILQDPSTIEVILVRPERGLFRINEKVWVQYCRWHSGPLDKPDNPVERIYCNLPADGYCRQHKKSERALYERCVTLHGDKGLGACKLLDRMVRSEYVVYLTDFGGEKPKIGITRRFRYLERLAEQTHITATVLTVTDSAYNARLLEIKASKMGLAQEMHRKSSFTSRPTGESAIRLSYWAERVAKALGVNWDGELIRVIPPEGWRSFLPVRKPETFKEVFRVAAFWGGYLYVISNERKAYFPVRPLQHKDSLELVEIGDKSSKDGDNSIG
ncbi:MAG: DUF2797 domain-containing protein [Desulfurococcales archaeon]|nr:DUF2797 domain-containing protein [Desulfurococcales archaeon]